VENQKEKEEKTPRAQRTPACSSRGCTALYSPLGGEHYVIVGDTLPRKTPAFLAELLSSVCPSSTHKTGFSSGLWAPQSGIIWLRVSPPPPSPSSEKQSG